MARSTEGVFTLFYIFEQRLSKRRHDRVFVLLSRLIDLDGDIVGHAQSVFEAQSS
ncbi:Uncharacterised protein [Vibrio cholerae]|nr:Uncharacterised protein [Vibrio cholerae]